MPYAIAKKPADPSEIIPKGLFEKMKEDPEIQDWHYELIKYLCLPRALRPSSHYIIGKFGISLAKYYYWLNHPKIIKAKNELSRYFFSDYVPDVMLAMRNEALAGNERAARLFLEFTQTMEPENKGFVAPDDMEVQEVQAVLLKIRRKKI